MKMDCPTPFAVVVTDMRMPRMDGLEFIRQARLKSPDTVYIMLTGNQDQRTSVQALNEGHVFRFLNKPCQSGELVNAIEAAIRQYQLVTSERELLQNTFFGAVSMLTDVLELSHPQIFGRMQLIQETVESLGSALKLERQWEYSIASRLALVGFALMPPDDRLMIEFGLQAAQDVNNCFRTAGEIGERLIIKIPRLHTVARIIGKMHEVDGSAVIQTCKTEDAKALMGATLLRVAIHWDYLNRQGLHAAASVAEMRRSLPNLSAEMISAMHSVHIDSGIDDEGIEIRAHELEEGMVLASDVQTCSGTMLIGRGRRVNATIIERLRCYPAGDEQLRPIRVTRSSTRSAADLMVG
jgi:response regulator RpfG family c-di-GMP phosphodiesterase